VNKAKLETKRQEVADRFSELNGEKEKIVTEMTCLQGEHRLLTKLINEWEEENGTELIESSEPISKPKKSPHRKGVEPSK